MPDAPARVVRDERRHVDYQALAKEYGQEPAGPARPAFQAEKMTSAEEALAEMKGFMGSLGGADKLAIIGAAMVVLSGFLPWKVTAQEGEVLGVVSLGMIGVLLGAGAAAAIWLRVSKAKPGLNPLVPWVLQLGAVAAGILFILAFIKLSWDGTMVPSVDGNVEMPASKPEAGVYIALVSELLALGGTLLGLKDSQAAR